MSLRILIGALVPLALIACAGGASDGTTGDDQNVTARPGELNGICGGIAGIRCKGNLRCELAGNFPDAGGKCVAGDPLPGELNGMCGGIAGIPCKPGLACKIEGQGFDLAGKCEATATCLAIPGCDPGDKQVQSCAAGSAPTDCYTRSMCGKTVNCKKSGSSAEVTLEGTLTASVGIGGENTGASIQTSTGLVELVLDNAERSSFVEGRFARVKGKKTELSGVETGKRSAVDVTKLLVCPNSSAVINCQPPLQPGTTICGEDRDWVQEKCAGVSFVD
jgi:hypothetical protein